ncbi:MAG: 4-(cytidine 5'-diphospho)-2-C-methyl-D-erythritol kinase [Alphaproteobacteria bacterium]|nr:4-(cytidine 5'-diphospho)-2-C-methyl-D-erythritol kinase [Alphaproteobacteria bacterium]
MSLLAPAKLNLYLHVVGRRADGFHLLDSLVAFVDIGDHITVSPAHSLNVAITGPFAKELAAHDPRQNLVWRAGEALARELGQPPGALVILEKNLPIASGIGGGSSDAAATLLSLANLWSAKLAPERLAVLGATLGADVPVCLAGHAAFIGGIGDQVVLAPALPEAYLVLVNPGRPLPTPDVYKSRQGPFGQSARFTHAPSDAAELAAILKQRRNDLSDAARAIVPEIDDVLAALAACDGALLARMSGSGATCFALFADNAAASAAVARVRGANPGWWVANGRLMS